MGNVSLSIQKLVFQNTRAEKRFPLIIHTHKPLVLFFNRAKSYPVNMVSGNVSDDFVSNLQMVGEIHNTLNLTDKDFSVFMMTGLGTKWDNFC